MSSFTLAWHFLIFGVLPYVVIAVLVLGSLARFVLAPYSWKSQSSEILDKKDIFWGANLFHIGVIFLFCGHCFGLFTPDRVAQRSRPDTASAPDDGNYLRRSLGNRGDHRSDYSDLAPFNQRACQSGLPSE